MKPCIRYTNKMPKNEYIIIGSGKLIVHSSKIYICLSLNTRMKRFLECKISVSSMTVLLCNLNADNKSTKCFNY